MTHRFLPHRLSVPTRLPALWAGTLLAAGLATFAAQASPSDHSHEGHRMQATGWGHGKHGGAHGGEAEMALRLSPRVLDRLEATPQQREQIRAIMEAARADLRSQHESARALRQRSMELLSQPTIDAAAMEALRKDMLAQRDRASQRQLQAVLEASRVLTPEQRKRLAEHAGRGSDMKERHHREHRATEAPKS